MVESDKGMLLPEFEVKAYDDQGLKPQNYYQSENNRDKYWTSIFGGTEMRSLFTDYSESQVLPALKQLLPPTFKLSESTPLMDRVEIIAPNDEKITIDVDFGKDRAAAEAEQRRLEAWLARNTTPRDIRITEENKTEINNFVRKAQQTRSDEGGLNVEHLRPELLKKYTTEIIKVGDQEYVDEENFTPNLFKFANKSTPEYTDVRPGSRTKIEAQEDDLEGTKFRRAQQSAFNSFVMSNADIQGLNGNVEYITMPTYVQDVNRGSVFDGDKLLSSYTKKPGTSNTKNDKLLNHADYDRISKYSIENEEAIFYYTDKAGDFQVFDTEAWSKANGGKNFTEFITQKAIKETIVPQELIAEEKRAFENYIETGRWEKEEREIQGKFILSNIELRSEQRRELASNKYVQAKIEEAVQNQSNYYTEILNEVASDPNAEIKIEPGEDLVEYETDYGVKVIIPKRFTDGAAAEHQMSTVLYESYKVNFDQKSKLLDEIEKAEDKWEVYKLNYSDAESAAQNFLLSTADFGTSILYGGYKYLTPYGWAMSALKANGKINEDPITELMLTFKKYQEHRRSYYNAPTEFGDFRTVGDFGSWFFNMAGTQIPQYATILFSGGSAYVPVMLMSTGAAGSTDLDFRQQVSMGDRDYNEFGVMWRSVLSGVSEGTFATLPTWKIMNKGKSLIKGLGGNAESQFFKSGRQYLKSQAPEVIKDVSLDTGFEVVNGIVQNVLADRPMTEGLPEIASTSLLISGPVAVASPVYYAMTTKDFIGADAKQRISDQSWKLSQLQKETLSLRKQVFKLVTPAVGSISPKINEFAQNKIQELNKKIAENNEIIASLESDIKTDFAEVDNLFKNHGVNPYGTKNYNEALVQMGILKGQAKEINQDVNLTQKQKQDKLDEINAQFLAIKQAQDQYLNKKNYGNAFYSLKMASVFNRNKKAELRRLREEATTSILSDKGRNYDPKQSEIDERAMYLYYDEIAEQQIAKDIKANPDLAVARTKDDAKKIIENADISDQDREILLNNIESGTQNGFYVGETFMVYKPNMITNEMFNTGGHENSHKASANLIRKKPTAFTGFGEQIVAFMENYDATLWQMLQDNNSNIKDKSGNWDYEEVIATFVEAVGSEQVKLNKLGNMPALLGTLFNKGLNDASDGEYNIPFQGQDDIVKWFIGLAKALNEGKISISKYETTLESALTERFGEEGRVIDMTQQEQEAEQRMAASEVKKSEVTLLDAISNLLPKDIKTKEQYDAFIRNERTAKPIIDALNKPGGAINNYIRSKQTSPEEGNEMIENTLFRLFNFNPEETRADGSVVGPEGFGERIFADTRFASLDARKKLAQEAAKKKQEVKQDDEAVRELAAPTEQRDEAEDKKARVTPKAKLPREYPEIFTPELVDEFETAMLEVYAGETPDLSDKEFKAFITDVARGKLSEDTKKALGTKNEYEFVVKKLAPKMKELLPIQWFVRLEGQTKPENRIFTKPPRRLTKKDEIDAAVRNDKVYVENTAQGVNLYEFADFNPKQLIDYLLPPLKTVSKKTGKTVRSGLRGTRKTALTEGIVDKLSQEASPSTAKKVGLSDREVAEISKKLQVDPRIKLSQTQMAKMDNAMGRYNYYDRDQVRKAKKVIVNKYAPIFGKSLMDRMFRDLIPGGGRGERLLGKQIAVGSFQALDSTKKTIEDMVAALVKKGRKPEEAIAEIDEKIFQEIQYLGNNQTLIENDLILDLTELKNQIESKGLKDNAAAKIMLEAFGTGQKLDKLASNLANLDNRKKATELLIDKFKEAYDADPKSAEVLREFIYNNKASGMMGKDVALMRGKHENATDSNKYEEHTYPFSSWAIRTMEAIKSKNPKVLEGWKKWASENYYQIAFDKTTKAPFTDVEGANGFYQGAVDQTFDRIDGKGEFKSQSQEHPLLEEALNKAFKTGDFSEVPSSDIRFFNEYVQLDPNKLYLDGKTYAEKYNVVVPEELQDYPNVIKEQTSLIFQQIIGDIDAATARERLDIYLNDLADTQQDANNYTEKEVKDSKVMNSSTNMDMETLLSQALTLDDALARATSLDQPVKKIRVFDFDDTIATSNSLVFYSKPNETGKPTPKNKAIFMIGGPGSGKTNIGKGLQLGREGWKVVNQDIFIEKEKKKAGLPESEREYTKEQRSQRAKIGAAGRKAAQGKLEKYTKAGDGMVIDGTGASYNATMKKVKALQDQGYEVFMVYAKTSDEVAQQRNKARKERSLPGFVVAKTQKSVNENIPKYKEDFGQNFMEIDTETLKYGEALPKDFVARVKENIYRTERGRLNAEEFAKQGEGLVNEGFVMDFSDFDIVREGNRGPLFDVAKKIKDARGNEDLFILTARSPLAQNAIYEFLKAEGLEFKRENIIGLGNSSPVAKADWIVNKAAEGYNDFYFADDAYKNVQAVQDALSVIDVKSKVQQARVKSSEVLDTQFNKILEQTTGIEYYKEYSAAKAKTVGASKGKFKFFIPYSAEDFMGLIYPTLGKGRIGDANMAWYKTHVLNPYTKAMENLSAARLNLMNDFKQLKKSLDVPKDLRKKTDSGFTNEQAVRVYLYDQMGYEVPGISKRDLSELKSIVQENSKLQMFAEQLMSITKGDGYPPPSGNWLVGTITTDLIDLINTEKRSKYLAEWQENVDVIYSEKNLNKLEAIYGSNYVEALRSVLARMKSGRNRLETGNRLSNKMLDYINGSIGTIMFFNTRSAVLQTISSINFVNWSFNNPLKAGQAFANQKQYWKDFMELMNSDYLMDRRNGLKLNISESEIADAAATSKNKAKAALNWILQKGYLPTQYADSFAIAAGGATFYRNRIKDLIKNEGKTEVEAKEQAMIEWRQIAEESQQSSDPSRISQQQSSDLGRIILAFANTPMQYARLQKRAIQDLINGRGDAKSHVSKIIYYGFVQNIIFNALQQAVFAIGFGDDEDDERNQERYLDTANGMLDSLLRGLGIGGATVSVVKNFLLDLYERSGRKRPEYVDSVWQLTKLSPPIGSKISKLKQAAWHFDSQKRRDKIFEKGFAIDNPAYEAFAKVISATVNIPLDRVLQKINNLEGAMNDENDMWQRIAMAAGWPEWQLKAREKSIPKTAEEKKQDKLNKAEENYKAAKGSTDYDTLKKLTAAQQIKMLKGLGFGTYTIKKAKSEDAKIQLIIAKNSGKKNIVDKKEIERAKYKALSKAEQVKKLDSLGLTKEQIKALKYEEDRVQKIMQLMK